MSANESQAERHIQIQNTDSFEIEPRLRKGRGERRAPSIEIESPSKVLPQKAFPLGMVLDACPDIIDHARTDISSWRDFLGTAELVRSMLGVSPDAWPQAQEVMGEDNAAIVIAAILQKGAEIKSAGGYLRSLTEKARGDGFSVGPVLIALLRSKIDATGRKKAG